MPNCKASCRCGQTNCSRQTENQRKDNGTPKENSNKLTLGNHKNENLLFVFLCWKNRVLFKYIFCAISDVIAQIYDGIN